MKPLLAVLFATALIAQPPALPTGVILSSYGHAMNGPVGVPIRTDVILTINGRSLDLLIASDSPGDLVTGRVLLETRRGELKWYAVETTPTQQFPGAQADATVEADSAITAVRGLVLVVGWRNDEWK